MTFFFLTNIFLELQNYMLLEEKKYDTLGDAGTHSMRMELQGNCLESSLPVASPPVLTSNMQNLITTSCNDQMLLLAYKIIT
jgi:hypothetical protein